MWIRTLDDRLINCDRVRVFKIEQHRKVRETKKVDAVHSRPSVVEVESELLADIGDDTYQVTHTINEIEIPDDDDEAQKVLDKAYNDGREVIEFALGMICTSLRKGSAVFDMVDVRRMLSIKREESKDGTGKKDEA